MRLLVALGCAGLLASSSGVVGHDGVAGDHFKVGFYNGHDGTYEAPADPAWPDTLLVDTHPWELDGVFWVIEPVSGGVLGDGWISEVPGFDGLLPEDEEFGGHGFFSFIDRSTRVALELIGATPGVEVLRGDLSALEPGDRMTLGSGPFHAHPFYWVDGSGGAGRGDFFDISFRVVDETGGMNESEPFTVRLVLGPGCVGDLAPDFGVYDLSDIAAFVEAFTDGDARADLAEPAGVFDLSDISVFVDAFTAGCP